MGSILIPLGTGWLIAERRSAVGSDTVEKRSPERVDEVTKEVPARARGKGVQAEDLSGWHASGYPLWRHCGETPRWELCVGEEAGDTAGASLICLVLPAGHLLSGC